jgi:hypothetical protein
MLFEAISCFLAKFKFYVAPRLQSCDEILCRKQVCLNRSESTSKEKREATYRTVQCTYQSDTKEREAYLQVPTYHLKI